MFRRAFQCWWCWATEVFLGGTLVVTGRGGGMSRLGPLLSFRTMKAACSSRSKQRLNSRLLPCVSAVLGGVAAAEASEDGSSCVKRLGDVSISCSW